ncbi:hypothetical protein E2C01_081716 [Portunus trituberculatus]|uniref:Uncharacterized protein n=1 Tax=Portunus trituberculatus TaxID=210409 RepID=A0A5B7J1V6_PORTR|nr:hypothetical protein [Portunus trituberculatus]
MTHWFESKKFAIIALLYDEKEEFNHKLKNRRFARFLYWLSVILTSRQNIIEKNPRYEDAAVM